MLPMAHSGLLKMSTKLLAISWVAAIAPVIILVCQGNYSLFHLTVARV